MKKCSKCHQWKPTTEYHKHRAKPDSLAYQCKACVSKRQREYYKKNRKEILAKTAKYYNYHNPRKRCKRCKQERRLSNYYPDSNFSDGLHKWCKSCYDMIKKGSMDDIMNQVYKRRTYQKNKVKILAKNRGYRRENKEIANAHNAIKEALRKGILIRPTTCSNPHCQGKGMGRIESHHESYEKEYWFAVIWLCSSCHKLVRRHGLDVVMSGSIFKMKN